MATRSKITTAATPGLLGRSDRALDAGRRYDPGPLHLGGGVCETSAAASAGASERPQTLADLARRDPTDPMALGVVDAPRAVIEYADFRCKYCALFAQDRHRTRPCGRRVRHGRQRRQPDGPDGRVL